jgi:hypothetical protein
MKTFIAIIAISMGLAGRASAQTDLAYAGTPEYTTPVAELTPGAISIEKAAKIAENRIMADSLLQSTTRLVANRSNGSTELLKTGNVLELTTTMGGVHSALEQHSVNVHVTYDARPVGGILNIRVELVPVFGGIGSAVRPTISRQFAEAVEYFDDDFIAQTILKLTNDLASELASNE